MTRRLRQRIADPLLRVAARRRHGLLPGLAAVLWYGLTLVPADLRRMPRAGPVRVLGDIGVGLWLFARQRLMPHEWRRLRHRPADRAAYLASGMRQIDLMAGLIHATIPAALRAKPAIADACRRHDLPHPATLVVDDRGDPALADMVARHAALLLKPAVGNRARGVALLRSGGDGVWCLLARGAAPRAGPWQDLLAAHLPGERLVVQHYLRNAAAIAELVGPSLLTVRAVTMRCTDGATTVLSALAEVPLDAGEPLPERMAVLPVDLESGQVRAPAPDRDWPVHPLTGRDWSSLAIQGWPVLRDLAVSAHGLLAPDLETVGWDLAMTDAGPVLIEGNANWSMLPHVVNDAGASGPGLRLSGWPAG